MLFPGTRYRFLPRSNDNNATARNQAALRALVSDLAAQLDKVQKEQDVQFRRIAQLQLDIDEIKRLLTQRRKPRKIR